MARRRGAGAAAGRPLQRRAMARSLCALLAAAAAGWAAQGWWSRHELGSQIWQVTRPAGWAGGASPDTPDTLDSKGEAAVAAEELEAAARWALIAPDALRNASSAPSSARVLEALRASGSTLSARALAAATAAGATPALDSLDEATMGATGDGRSFLAVCLADAAAARLAANWAAHLSRLGVPHVVAALDWGALRALRAAGLGARAYALGEHAAAVRAGAFEGHGKALSVDAGHKGVRWRAYVAQRTGQAAALVAAGFDVLLSDADNVFLRDPRPYFYCRSAAFPGGETDACGEAHGADVYVSSDNLSPSRDDERRVEYARNGVLNTGILFWRATRAGRAAVDAWREHATEPDADFARLTTEQEVWKSGALPKPWVGGCYSLRYT